MTNPEQVEVKVLGTNGARDAVASNVLEALEAAGYSPEVSIRLNGQAVPNDQAGETPVQKDDTIVAAAPALNGGQR